MTQPQYDLDLFAAGAARGALRPDASAPGPAGGSGPAPAAPGDTASAPQAAADAALRPGPEGQSRPQQPDAQAAGAESAALAAARTEAGKYLREDAGINEAFAALVILRVEQYLADLEGVQGLPPYDMIVSAAERPLLKWAMDKAEGKQLAAAKILGINRNTLRKKLRMHGFLEGGL